MKEKKPKMLRLSAENLEVRNAEENESKMIIEGYPIVFNKETPIFDGQREWLEQIDRNAFANADMSDVALKYNHNDNVFILARTRNGSLTLSIDDHGVFMHAELIDTTTNRDVYEMVRSKLLTEGSFAFTVVKHEKYKDAEGREHRNITEIGKLFDVAICPNGAYGDLTEIYARSYDLAEAINDTAEAEKRCAILRLKNKNKLKFLEAKNGKH